jgi:two-component system response regulator DevR
MQTVFIVAANRFFRESLVCLLGAAEGLPVLGAGEFSTAALQQIAQRHPDIVVLSPDWRDTEFQATRAIRDAEPRAKVLMITMEDDKEVFFKAVRAGAVGYLLKNASAEEIVAAVRRLVKDSVLCPRHLERVLFDYVATGAPAHTELTQRERQLISLIGQGLTNKEIAARLHLSEQTVKNHVHRILRKTGSVNRTGLTQLARTERSSGSQAGQPATTPLP